jgi:hypothetical protein
MSSNNIGDTVDGCKLLKRNRRNGRIELWYNHDSGFYGIYLFKNVQQDEEWLSYKETKDKEKAQQISDTIADILVA